MEFKKIELTGFKSFVEKTSFFIEKGLTGIVGPNGCGKSNIVEAIRWCMGETSAKSMRGTGMEDVIFSGTANKTSKNIAEVSLTLDNSDKDGPIQFKELDLINIKRYDVIFDYLKKHNIIGIQDLDTRAITRIIREDGAMNAIISSEILDHQILKKQLLNTPSMHGLNLAKRVTCIKNYQYSKPDKISFKVIAIDFGIKTNILRLLKSRGCDITVVPSNITSSEIRQINPDGVFLSKLRKNLRVMRGFFSLLHSRFHPFLPGWNL